MRSPGSPLITSGYATDYLVTKTCLSLLLHKQNIWGRNCQLMCLLTDIYTQLSLPRCGHVANQNHACQQIQVRLNERHFGLKNDLRVPNCSNSPGGGGMSPDVLTHVPCSTWSVPINGPVEGTPKSEYVVYGYEMQYIERLHSWKLTSGDHTTKVVYVA